MVKGSNISRQICKSTSEWREFESRWFYQSGFEFAKTPLSTGTLMANWLSSVFNVVRVLNVCPVHAVDLN